MMDGASPFAHHAALMDGVYRRQRHIYDATRKYFLLGRDKLIGELALDQGGTVLEIGCGTGRNLALVSSRWPGALLFGLDISEEMLASARKTLGQVSPPVDLAQADASQFDPLLLFGKQAFDRVFISYCLSMIPQWQAAIEAALKAVKPGGSLHVVDFGTGARLPGWFRAVLLAWLSRFHVSPRTGLEAALHDAASRHGGELFFSAPWRGYAVLASIRLPASEHPCSPPS